MPPRQGLWLLVTVVATAVAATAGSARADNAAEAQRELDRGIALYRAGDLAAAREAFTRARDAMPAKSNPYRYLGPRPDPKSDGYGRRNLAYDIYFGVKGGGSSGWLNAAQNGAATYVQESNLISVPAYQTQIGQFQRQLFEELEASGGLQLPILRPAGEVLDDRKLRR